MKSVKIVSMGPGDESLVTLEAKDALAEADLVIGARRLLESLPKECTAVKRFSISSQDIAKILREESDWNSAVLVMSGDAGLFSGAKRALEEIDEFEISIVPGVSSAQLFAARLRRPWQNWRFESAHGIDCDIVALVRETSELFLATGGVNSVTSLCLRLCEAGLGSLHVSVGERLSYPDEKISIGTAERFSHEEFDSLAVMLVDRPEGVLGDFASDGSVSAHDNSPAHNGASAHGDTSVYNGASAYNNANMHLRSTPWPFATMGIADEAFERGSAPMTKQEVRAVALAKLGITPTDVVYDIGAGTGSVSIEAARIASQGNVYAIERHVDACDLVRLNAKRFGLKNIAVVEGLAPDVLQGIPPANAAFIGGAGGNLASILDYLVDSSPSIRVCVTAITIETLSKACELLSNEPFTDFEICQVAVSRAHTVGTYHMMRSENPIFIITARAGGSDEQVI